MQMVRGMHYHNKEQCFGPKWKCITTNDLILSVLFCSSELLPASFGRISFHFAIYKMH